MRTTQGTSRRNERQTLQHSQRRKQSSETVRRLNNSVFLADKLELLQPMRTVQEPGQLVKILDGLGHGKQMPIGLCQHKALAPALAHSRKQASACAVCGRYERKDHIRVDLPIQAVHDRRRRRAAQQLSPGAHWSQFCTVQLLHFLTHELELHLHLHEAVLMEPCQTLHLLLPHVLPPTRNPRRQQRHRNDIRQRRGTLASSQRRERESVSQRWRRRG